MARIKVAEKHDLYYNLQVQLLHIVMTSVTRCCYIIQLIVVIMEKIYDNRLLFCLHTGTQRKSFQFNGSDECCLSYNFKMIIIM